jgi:hypothetical protein
MPRTVIDVEITGGIDSSDLLARAEALAPQLRTRAIAVEDARTLPADVVDSLETAEMFRLGLPETSVGSDRSRDTRAHGRSPRARKRFRSVGHHDGEHLDVLRLARSGRCCQATQRAAKTAIFIIVRPERPGR